MIEKHWQDLIKPNEIDIQSEGAVTKLTVEPLERGFGFTLGAALRRILLSCLEGVAVTAVRIGGVHADSAAIPGVREDLADILLNSRRLPFAAGTALIARAWPSASGARQSSPQATFRPKATSKSSIPTMSSAPR